MLAHIVGNSRLLHNAAIGSKVAVHNAQTAVRAVGVFNGTNNFTINLRAFLDPFSHRTVARHGLAVEQAVTTKFADDGGNAANRIQILDMERTGRSDARDVRDLLANLIPVVHGNGAAGCVADCSEVEHGVGRPTKSHIKRHAVTNGMLVDDVERGDVLRYKFHNLHTRMLCKANALRVHSRDSAIAGKGDSQTLRQAADRVRGEHARAATASGTCGVLEPLALFFGHSASGYLTHRVKQGVQVGFISALVTTGKHGAAGNKDRRNVQTTSGKKHARNNLVTRRNEHHTIKLVTLHNALNRIGNNLTASKGEMHTLMVHGDAVAHADSGCLQRRTTRHADTCFNSFSDLIQVIMAGNDVIGRRDNGDEWALDLLIGQTVSL